MQPREVNESPIRTAWILCILAWSNARLQACMTRSDNEAREGNV